MSAAVQPSFYPTTANVIGIATAAVASAGYAVANFARRRIAPRSAP
jgi:hypothetical protein